MGITHIDSSFKFSIEGGNQRNGVEEGELKRRFFFFLKMREITGYLCAHENNTATVYKTFSLAELVSSLILEKDNACYIF